MKLNKIGLIPFKSIAKEVSWAENSMLQPTPLIIDDNTIRIYCGMRDELGISRVGYIDIDPKNPLKIKNVSTKPVLDIGEPGMFDENGVVPCAVIKKDNKIILFYAGYQLGNNVRFYVFSGMASSTDGGETFTRESVTPVTDRSDKEPLFRVIHSIHQEGNGYRCWYGAGGHFRNGGNKTLPVYNVRTMFSKDLLKWPESGEVVVDIKKNEHRIGRPYVVKEDNNKYAMFYGYGSEQSPYNLGYAFSDDGKNWKRKDSHIELTGDTKSWEDEMQAYPALVQCSGEKIFFYNGNKYGIDGIGVAIATS